MSATWQEDQLLRDIDSVHRGFKELSKHGTTHEADMTEVRFHIHALQNVVLANVGARDLGDDYREFGGDFVD